MSPASPSPARSAFRPRAVVLVGVAIPIALIGSMLGACPATAASATVTTKADLKAAFAAAASGDTITLGRDLVGDGGSDDALTVPDSTSVTLNLNGYELDVDLIAATASSRLVVVNSTSTTAPLLVGTTSVAAGDAGPTGVEVGASAFVEVGSGVRLRASGSSGRAGIGTVKNNDGNALLYIDAGATVTATGGSHGAGIGGGEGAVPLSTISIGDASVTATGGAGAAGIGGGYANPSGSTNVRISGTATGRVTATGGAGGAGIGGGMADPGTGGGVGSAVTVINGDVTVADGGRTPGAASGTTAPSAIGGGQGASAGGFGSLSNTFTGAAGQRSALLVAAGAALSVPAGKTITNSGNLIVRGTLTGSGTIANANGTIRREAPGVLDDGNLTVTGRNYAVTFDRGAGTTTAPAVQHVYAPTFGTAGLDLSAYTGSSGDSTLVGWSGTSVDASGTSTTTPVLNDTALAPLVAAAGPQSGSFVLTAVYERPIVFRTTALPNAAVGQAYDVAAPTSGAASTFTVASDPSTTLPTGTIPALPSGLSVNPATGAISGRPTTAGRYSFLLTAASRYQSVSQAVTIDIAGAPAIATTELPGATAGTAYRAPILATSDHGTLAFGLSGGVLPAGIGLDPATGVLSGTPTSSGTFTFGVTVSNGYGSTETTLSVTVAPAAIAEQTAPPAPPAAESSPQQGQAPTGTGTGTTAPSSPAAPPVLPSIPAITVKLGHPLWLSVAASSTGTVTYSVPAKDLPAGFALDTRKGLLFGAPRAAGRFVLHVTARNAAGSTTSTYTILVPKPTRLVTGSASAVTPTSGTPVTVTVRGLLAGERWRIAVDGHPAQTGIATFGGSVKRSVKLPRTTRDKRHVIRVSGDRRVTDPSVLTAHEVTVTAVVAKKTLRLTRAGSRLTVRGLAAKERVTITRGHVVLARGRADSHGLFAIAAGRLKAGVHTVVGSTKHRLGTLRVTLPSKRRSTSTTR